MFERVLVPVDGSGGALAALKVAIEMQKAFDAELYLLSVYRHHSLLEGSMSMLRPSEPDIMDKVMEDYAKEVAEKCKHIALEQGSRHVRAFVKSGQPARTIVSFARERDMKLIVLGSRGLDDVEGYLLGSVSHKVTSLADCPVMVV